MRASIVALIVIGVVSLIGVISLGVYFATRPKQTTTTYLFGLPKDSPFGSLLSNDSLKPWQPPSTHGSLHFRNKQI